MPRKSKKSSRPQSSQKEFSRVSTPPPSAVPSLANGIQTDLSSQEEPAFLPKEALHPSYSLQQRLNLHGVKKQRKLGTKCIVKANHFLAELPENDLNQYDVTITPEASSRAINRSIIAELVKTYKESDLGMKLPAYDGRKSLYTAGELPFYWKEFTVKLINEDDSVNGPKRQRDYKVAIKFVARANLHHLGQFLAGKCADGPKEALQILDIVLRELSSKR
ncbi:Protein argonaute 10 [Castilleja foliolosa]|uniref:Protein argonaute 10 n=1 Tax=Castilleja foliolosa TaxID=1961234 RepID=A0ABD3EFJ4_9LAMI